MDRNLLASPFIIIFGVALRKESVDRNARVGILISAVPRRSPQGERG